MKHEDMPRQEIALSALEDIRSSLEGRDRDEVLGDIDHTLHLAYARLRMASQKRDRRNPRWLGEVASYTIPLYFQAAEDGEDRNLVSFIVEITDGPKSAVGRKVEVRMHVGEAIRFAGNMTITASAGPHYGMKQKNDFSKLLPKGDVNE